MAGRGTAGGLSTEELETIRGALSAGRRPKVVFTEAAGQIAGQVGQVVALTDPAESEEWVVVRFGRDELPFSPADLAVAPKGAPVRRPEPKAEPEPVVAGPELRLTVPPAPVPAPRAEPQEAGSGPAGSPAPGGAGPVEAKPALPARKASKAAKPKAPAGLTVTVAYADGEWTVSAMQGAKVLAKPYVLRPAEALRMVSMLDVPGVHEAVEQIVSAERAEAEQQAERLRAELAEIEARLAELREAG